MSIRRKLAFAAVLLAACSFAGGAFAATRDSGGSSPHGFLNDLASRLHVTPQQLTTALKGALADQLNAAVKAGKLTKAQANAIEQRVGRRGFLAFGLPGLGLTPGFGPRLGQGGPLGLGPGGPLGLGPRGPLGLGPRGPLGPGPIRPSPFGFGAAGGALQAAARYLGMSGPQLLAQLRGGRSLSQIASSRGKSVSGLKAAIVGGLINQPFRGPGPPGAWRLHTAPAAP